MHTHIYIRKTLCTTKFALTNRHKLIYPVVELCIKVTAKICVDVSIMKWEKSNAYIAKHLPTSVYSSASAVVVPVVSAWGQ